MIKAVLFDLDNTLIDFLKMKLTCSRVSVKAMIKAGLRMSEKRAYEKLINIYSKTSFEDSRIFQKFLKKTVGKIDYKILSAGIVAYRSIVNGLLTPYKGVVPTLKALKKKELKLGIVTDAPKLKAWIRLSNAGLTDYFSVVVTLGDAKVKKPNKLPFQKALKQLKLKPEEVLFVGDSTARDVGGANRIGMKTVLAAYGDFEKRKPRSKHEIPDYTIKSISELRGIKYGN